jgi:ATP-binding cassette subfamily B multidrug efflux pump
VYTGDVASSVRYLRPYARKYGAPALLAVVFVSVEAAADLLQPTIMARIVDVGVANRDLSFVLRSGALMLAVAALGALAAVIRSVVASTVSQRFAADLRADLYRTTMSLSFAALDRFETASLVTRLTNDVNQVQVFVNGMMRIFFKAPLLAIGAGIMAWLLDPGLARILLVVLPVVAVLVALSLRLGYPRYREVQAGLDRVNGVFREYLAGARVVKAFNRFDYETQRFGVANQALARTSSSAMRVMAAFTPAIALAMNLGIIAVLWLGGYGVDGGQIGAGQVIAFVNYMTQILVALMIVAFIFNTFVRARASSDRIREVMMAAQPEGVQAKPAPAGAVPPALSAGHAAGPRASATLRAADSICFDRVSFTYVGGADLPTLRDVSFSCQRGQTLGIIGPTGAGKTSLIALIPRFREATSGVVRVDGLDVRDQQLHELRGGIAIVPQRTTLFTGSIRENIAWGRPHASEDEIEAAARMAQAHEFIAALPVAYEARIGRGGVNLSGGQKQRLAIARALIRRPRILILDDSSSAVDSITEARLRRALRQELSGVTLVNVAQRVTSVMDADQIIVLDDGVAAGIGTHAQLLETCEVYRDIYRSQVGGPNV